MLFFLLSCCCSLFIVINLFVAVVAVDSLEEAEEEEEGHGVVEAAEVEAEVVVEAEGERCLFLLFWTCIHLSLAKVQPIRPTTRSSDFCERVWQISDCL